MELNKIMEENLSNFDRDGCLGYKKVEKYFYEKNNQKWGQVETTAGRYFMFDSRCKEADDADIFFSQLYPKFGIDTPTYFSVKDELTDEKFLVANDLSTDQKSMINRVLSSTNVKIFVKQEEMRGSTVLAKDFYHYLTEKHVKSKILEQLDNCYPILNYFKIKKLEKAYVDCESEDVGLTILDPFFATIAGYENPALKQFRREAVKKELKMKLLDIATFNNARLPSNYLYKVNNFLHAEDVIPLDSGSSWENVDYQINGLYNYDNLSLNDFSYSRLTPIEILKHFEENKAVQEYFDKNDRLEFAKQLREVTQTNIAKEVEDKTYYKINRRYQDVIYDNMEIMADKLEKGV